jgi:6-phosphogluconolactonase
MQRILSSDVKDDGGYKIVNHVKNLLVMEQNEEMKPTLVQIWKTRKELEKSVAGKIFDVIHKSLKENERCCIALSGGETPKNVYRQMGRDKASRLVDWSRIHVFFCDERTVPPNDPKSNYGMIEREWISHISIPQGNVHRMRGEIDPSVASQEYEQEIRKVFDRDPIVFELVLLGLGEDGHTASLFPGTEAVPEKEALVRPTYVQKMNSWRITLTVPFLNAAREIIFFVVGKQKASIVQRVLDTKILDPQVPASLIRPMEGNLCWMIDEEAGMLLKEHSSLSIKRMK